MKKGGILKKMKVLKLVMLIACQAFEQFFFIFFLLNALKGVNKAGSVAVFNLKNGWNFDFKILNINCLFKGVSLNKIQ